MQAIKWIQERPVVVAGLAVGFYLVLALAVTWPFALHPSSTTIAPIGGDVDSSIAKFQALRLGHEDPLFSTHFQWISWPQGPVDDVGVDRVSLFSTLFLWIGTHLFGAITAHSLLSLLGMVLTATVVFLLVWRVTGSKMAGVVGGLIPGFSSTMYGLIGSDMTYTNMWLDALPLWAFWELAVHGYTQRWRVLLAIVSVVPAVFWTPYYMLHAMVVGCACLAVTAWYLGRQRGWLRAVALMICTGVAWAALLYVYRYVGLHTPSSQIPARALADSYQESVQPLMFALPGIFSIDKVGYSLLVHLVPRARYVNLYVGLSTLALTTFGAVRLWQSRRKATAHLLEVQLMAVMAGVAAAACVAFSLPPTYHFGSVTVPTPDYLVAHTVPALRAGQRFVMPLLICLGVLAGIGVWMLIRNLPMRTRILVTTVLLLITGLDLWALPPHDVTTISTYPALVQLGRLPVAPVAWYQDGSLAGGLEHIPCLLQHEFNMPLINDCSLGRSADLGQLLTLPVCDQMAGLAAMGARYMVIANARDRSVRSCLAASGLAQRVVGQDSAYEVIMLRTMTPAERHATKQQLGLP